MQTNPESGITVVSGLPRSGTSLMMRMLEAGGVPVLTDHRRRPDEDNPNGYYELERIKRVQSDSAWMAGASGMAVKAVYLLLYHLPRDHHYQVILMRRELEEVVASQTIMLRRRNQPLGALSAPELVQAFQSQMRELETWLQTQPNFDTLQLSYHDVLRESRETALEVQRFLGRTLDVEAMIGVVDPALYRQRIRLS